MFWFFGRETCGIFAPQPGIEHAPPVLEGKVLTTRLPGRSLTNSSWLAYRFLRGQVRWSGIPILLRIFNGLLWSAVNSFHIVNEAHFFLEFPSFLYDPMDVGNLISGSSAFSKPSLYIWKFSVHVLLKSSLEDFEHYLATMWKEFHCTVVWTVYGIDLWDCNETWPVLVLWPLLSFPNYWHIESIIL